MIMRFPAGLHRDRCLPSRCKCSSVAAQAPADSTAHHIAVSLVPETQMPSAGSDVTIGNRDAAGRRMAWLLGEPWRCGLPLKIDWNLPQGASAGPPAYPVPSTLLISGMMNHVYEDPYALLLPIHIPDDARPAQGY